VLVTSVGASSGAQARKTYVALGASITYGIGASSPSKSYAQQYFGYLQSTAGVTDLYTMSKPGWTSTDLRTEKLNNAVTVINDASSDTTNVTIDIGYNDLFVDPNCPTANASTCPFATNLRAILDGLNTALGNDPGDETVQVMQMYNPDMGTPSEISTRQLLLGTDGTVDCSGVGAALGLNDLTHCIAIEKGARTVDVLPPFDSAGVAYLAPDHSHPNDAGHLAIAHAFGGAADPTAPPPPPGALRLKASKPKLSRSAAGKAFTASMLVTRADTGKRVKGRVSCQGRLGGKSLRARSHSSSSAGRSSCTWRLPVSARSKQFRGSITVSYQGAIVSRSFATKI
jgi:lysophospholipase L1-like esterase